MAARASLLSRAQTAEVLQALHAYHPQVAFDMHWIETVGDRDQRTSLRDLEKSDFFTRDIDQLQLSGGCSIAIHSAKDLPEPLPQGLVLAALTRGVDPADALVFRDGESLATLPLHARIGTSSKRREETLKVLRPDLCAVDIRGTIERRLELLDQGHVDGVIMAEAALLRLGLTQRHRLKLSSPAAFLQGRLAVLARADDVEILDLFTCLDARQNVLYLGTDPASYQRLDRRITHYPVIEVVPRPLPADFFASLSASTHVIFSSKNSVRIFFDVAHPNLLAGKRIIAVGRATGAALELKGCPAHLIAEEERQEGIIALLCQENLEKSAVFYPHSAKARPLLSHFLRERGIAHYAYETYDTVVRKQEPVPALQNFDELVFTSPSTVDAFLTIYGYIPKNTRLTTIGPITEEALQRRINL